MEKSNKTKLLFVIESLKPAGAEKSLVTLLNLIDPERFDIDLQLFSYGGEFESMLPSYVTLLPELPYFKACEGSLLQTVSLAPRGKRFRYLFSRIAYSIDIRTKKYTNPEKAVRFWKHCGKSFDKCDKTYDFAIAYAQGVPTFYVADCISPKIGRFAWVNVDFRLKGFERSFSLDKYLKYDRVCAVSDQAMEVFSETFPELSERLTVIKDINDGRLITKMSELPSNADTDMADGPVRILTVGRLAAQKGYDIAVEACRILFERGISFTWYVLGKGPLEAEIREKIRGAGIDGRLVLLGVRGNPYPYFRKADIYVQTSKHEGFGLAIAEARILNVPVVTTNFDAVWQQMINGENGLVVDMNAEAVADGIEKMISDRDLYVHIKEYLQNEEKGNYGELDKFYSMLDTVEKGR